jgi:hypothetical protein
MRGHMVADNGNWYTCPDCVSKKKNMKINMLPTMSGAYIKDLLCILDNLLQALAIVDVGLHIEEKYQGFFDGKLSHVGIITSPFIVMRGRSGTDCSETTQADMLDRVLRQNLSTNHLIQTYKTCL